MSHIDHILQDCAHIDDQNCRSFSHVLIRLIQERGYEGDEQDFGACARFLHNRYQNASVPPAAMATLKNWFSGESRPFFEKRSRERMYELCFALGFDYRQVYDFFEHVYLSRSFNCRNIQEAVYCFCFSRHMDYPQAKRLHSAAGVLLSSPDLPPGRDIIMYTGNMERDILAIESDQEFLVYVRENEKSFREYNQSARRELKRLATQIQGSSHDQKLVNFHRKNGTELSAKECETLLGLAVKEYFFYGGACRDLKGQNVTSADFMLSQILGIRLRQYYETEERGKSFSRDARLEPLARINFPSGQSLSDILKGKDHTSFDSIRKMIILLHFYKYFASAALAGEQQEFYSAYIDAAGDQLSEAGYGPLYTGSPYDRIFMDSAEHSRPLDYFRDVIQEAVDGSED